MPIPMRKRVLETVDIPWVQKSFAQLVHECESVDDGEQSSVVSGGEGGDAARVTVLGFVCVCQGG